jgi:hypothetical protein
MCRYLGWQNGVWAGVSEFYGDRVRSKIVIIPSKCLHQHVPFWIVTNKNQHMKRLMCVWTSVFFYAKNYTAWCMAHVPSEVGHVVPSAVLTIHSYKMRIVVSYLLFLIYIILVTVLVFISSMYTLKWPLCMFLIIPIHLCDILCIRL